MYSHTGCTHTDTHTYFIYIPRYHPVSPLISLLPLFSKALRFHLKCQLIRNPSNRDPRAPHMERHVWLWSRVQWPSGPLECKLLKVRQGSLFTDTYSVLQPMTGFY